MDKLRKIKPVINYFNKKFKEVYAMKEDIAIDELLMKFKGCMFYKQFNPSKRTKIERKFYKLCELSKSILYKGHCLYIDFVKAKFRKGECRMGSYNGILALKWKDKRDVHIISTKVRNCRKD